MSLNKKIHQKKCKKVNENHFNNLLVIMLLCSVTPSIAADIYAPWLTQIGLNTTILSNAKWGYGVKLGIVDTGIANSSYFFTKGQVSNQLSGCGAVTFSCNNGYFDEQGHGTAVAAVAAGNKLLTSFSAEAGYITLPKSIVSVAPSSNLIAVKVFNGNTRVTTFDDVANGVRRAADAGAQVINVSISYSNSAQDVAAINYAASKGAFIVWAGGNESMPLLNNADTVGFTPEAIKRFVFAGSVDFANTMTSFTNTPGSGAMVANGVRSPYPYRWLMAPGEGVLAPDVINGSPIDWKYWAGTSFSAPIVTASIGLLINTWPILKTEGSAADLLLATATNLGKKGVDTTFGSGLINLTTAFQPYGDVSMKGAKGAIYTTSTLNGSLLASGALGKLSKIKSKLKKYNGFDEFNRNFKLNLSGMVTNPRAKAIINPLPTFKKKKPKALKFADESIISAWVADDANEAEHLGEFGFNPESDYQQQAAYYGFQSSEGDTVSFGYDFPAHIAYQQALFGQLESIDLVNDFSDELSNLAEGGKLFAFGTQLTSKARLALSWHSNLNDIAANNFNLKNQASKFKLGFSYQLSPTLTSAISMGLLKEQNGFLGSQYQKNGLLSFSQKNESESVDISAIYKLNKNNHLLFETAYAKTNAGEANGIIAGTTDVISQSFNTAFVTKNFYQKDDQLSISIQQPLRVISGQAGVIVSGVDDLGYATYKTEWADLKPDGREIDYLITYETPIDDNQIVRLQAAYRNDVLNIKGNTDVSIGFTYDINF